MVLGGVKLKEPNGSSCNLETGTRRLLDSDADSTISNEPHTQDGNIWDHTIAFAFEDEGSESTFYGLISVLNVLALCFVVCMSLTICSSRYTVHESALDPIMLMVDIFLVDISSAFFVMSGFMCAFIYSSIGEMAFQSFRGQMLIFIFVDLWLSGICSVLFGSITALIQHEFHFHNVFFTVFEHATSLRLFDVHQSLDAPHNMNVGSWPVQCLVWCLLTVHVTYSGNNFLREKFGHIGSYAIMVSAVCGIVLFTLFGMLHSRSNIFYANATNFTYRTLEFNLGIHFFYLINMNEVIATTLMRLVHQSSRGILFLFLCIWWSEIGSSVESPSSTVDHASTDGGGLESHSNICLRMYPRNQCLRDHHAFLLRGCCLGITLISMFAYENAAISSLHGTDFYSNKHVLMKVTIYSTAVTFCWPAYEAIQLIFQITFSEQLIERNMALMSILQPMFLVSGAVLYSLFVKPSISLYVQEHLCHAHTHALALWKGEPIRRQNDRGDVDAGTEAGERASIPDLEDMQDLNDMDDV